MKVTKSLVIAAVLCVAKVNAIDFSSGAGGVDASIGGKATIDTTGTSQGSGLNEEVSTADRKKEVPKGLTFSDVEKKVELSETNSEDCGNEYDMANSTEDCDESLDMANSTKDCDENLDIAKEDDDCADGFDIAVTKDGEKATESAGGGETAGGESIKHTYDGGENENIDTTNSKGDVVTDDTDCIEEYDIAESECSDEYEIAQDDCTDQLDIASANSCADEFEMADKVGSTAGNGGAKPADTGNDAAKQTAFSVEAVKFQSGGPSSTTTSMAVPLAATAAACAALAIVGVIYVKRRSKKSKEAESGIFTVDKNSAL
ncbi:unnamed protein product [Peronospora destructor]|uniref:Uncharacterized protein n=1 Tax=Peronospora destructor TaxID=86335 RepID=A0AAV0TWU5_9STRA|nr:unnamed protein product [Peronospora destructor]